MEKLYRLEVYEKEPMYFKDLDTALAHVYECGYKNYSVQVGYFKALGGE